MEQRMIQAIGNGILIFLLQGHRFKFAYWSSTNFMIFGDAFQCLKAHTIVMVERQHADLLKDHAQCPINLPLSTVKQTGADIVFPWIFKSFYIISLDSFSGHLVANVSFLLLIQGKWKSALIAGRFPFT